MFYNGNKFSEKINKNNIFFFNSLKILVIKLNKIYFFTLNNFFFKKFTSNFSKSNKN